MSQLWLNIPEELRALKQWCVGAPMGDPNGEKRPLVCGANGFANASINNPHHLKTFDEIAYDAYTLTQRVGAEHFIGLVLNASDPYVVIDMDNKVHNPATDVELERYGMIIDAFDSYTELSASGRGAHVVIKGPSGPGLHRDKIEVYSQSRFMVMTGNVIRPKVIANREELLERLLVDLRAATAKADDTILQDDPMPDECEDAYLIERASNDSDNGAKFLALCQATASQGEGDKKVAGSFTTLGYPSQSEADLALMSMFWFWSCKVNDGQGSAAQCCRLFKSTGLGQRSKCTDQYMRRTLKRTATGQAQAEQLDAAIDFDAMLHAQALRNELSNPTAPTQVLIGGAGERHTAVLPVQPDLPWPPGLAGEIAQFIFQSAPRPVKEVAIVGAMGLLAGICGKAFQLEQTGLNMYMILVAASGTGKEAMHSGIGNLLAAIREVVPSATDFVTFDDYVSGPALLKQVAQKHSFVNVAGEWGKKLKRLAQEDGRGADGPMGTLRTVMTNLYQKSGRNSVAGGMSYSDKDKNVAIAHSVAYSMIGETTPGTFLESLTESMMEDGFMSRFNVVMYTGGRPPMNRNQVTTPPRWLSDKVANLCVQSLTLLSRFQFQQVHADVDGQRIIDEFNERCDAEYAKHPEESWKQMWNRAHLKVHRLAGLLAAADNCMMPVITGEHATWALNLVMRDISIMRSKISGGDVGRGDVAQSAKLLSVLREYITDTIPDGYSIPASMKEQSVVPRKYIQMRVQRHAAFYNDKNGVSSAIDRTLRSLMDNGNIREVDKASTVSKYSFHGKCYQIIELPRTTED
jgi:hypothetical protein